MGCDIHLVLEKRDHDRGLWVGTNNYRSERMLGSNEYRGVPTHRHYRRFAALAGVRGIGPAPRGVPEDASDLARMEIARWGCDGHSHGWLTLVEAARVWGATSEEPPRARECPEWYYFGVEDDQSDYRVV